MARDGRPERCVAQARSAIVPPSALARPELTAEFDSRAATLDERGPAEGSPYGTPRSVSHGCGRPRRSWPGARSGRGPGARRRAIGPHRAPASVERSSHARAIAFYATRHSGRRVAAARARYPYRRARSTRAPRARRSTDGPLALSADRPSRERVGRGCRSAKGRQKRAGRFRGNAPGVPAGFVVTRPAIQAARESAVTLELEQAVGGGGQPAALARAAGSRRLRRLRRRRPPFNRAAPARFLASDGISTAMPRGRPQREARSC